MSLECPRVRVQVTQSTAQLQEANCPVHAVLLKRSALETGFGRLTPRLFGFTESIHFKHAMLTRWGSWPDTMPVLVPQGANGPVHAVLAENWVVYTYWSAAAHRFQASVLELYDDSPRSLGPVQLVFGTNNATLSSYQPAQLQVQHDAPYAESSVELSGACTIHVIGRGLHKLTTDMRPLLIVLWPQGALQQGSKPLQGCFRLPGHTAVEEMCGKKGSW